MRNNESAKRMDRVPVVFVWYRPIICIDVFWKSTDNSAGIQIVNLFNKGTKCNYSLTSTFGFNALYNFRTDYRIFPGSAVCIKM